MELSLKADTTDGELSCYAIFQEDAVVSVVWKFTHTADANKQCKTFKAEVLDALIQDKQVKHYFIGIDNNHFRAWAPRVENELIHFVSIGELSHIAGIDKAKQIYPETLLNIQATLPKPPMNVYHREPVSTNYFSGCFFATTLITSAVSVGVGVYLNC